MKDDECEHLLDERYFGAAGLSSAAMLVWTHNAPNAHLLNLFFSFFLISL